METVSVNTSQHIDIDYPVAGLGERVAARCIDLGILIATLLIFSLLFGMIGILQGSETTVVVLLIIYAVGFVFYDLLFEIFMDGQSIGKRIMKIKVISLDGAQPSIGQYFIRWVFRIVDFILASPAGGLVFVAVTEHKQRLGDIVAGTTLIKTVQRTTIEHIAFHPVANEYIPVFNAVHQLQDRDIELIHEVISTYYKTFNQTLVYRAAEKVSHVLNITKPTEMNELEFLKTVIKDYSQLTSAAV